MPNQSSPATTVKTSLPNHQVENANWLKEAHSKSKLDFITLISLSYFIFHPYTLYLYPFIRENSLCYLFVEISTPWSWIRSTNIVRVNSLLYYVKVNKNKAFKKVYKNCATEDFCSFCQIFIETNYSMAWSLNSWFPWQFKPSDQLEFPFRADSRLSQGNFYPNCSSGSCSVGKYSQEFISLHAAQCSFLDNSHSFA